MSERKTAEIKFRVEPSAKARWQALADTKGRPLSEEIRDAMDSRAALSVAPEPTDFYGGPDFDAPGVADIAVPAATPQADVSTSGEVGANCERGCKSWEFCACKAFEDSVTR